MDIRETYMTSARKTPEVPMAFKKKSTGTRKLVEPETGLYLQRTIGWLAEGTRVEFRHKDEGPIAGFVVHLTFSKDNKLVTLAASREKIHDSVTFHSDGVKRQGRHPQYGEDNFEAVVLPKIQEALHAYLAERVLTGRDPRLPKPELRVEIN